MLLNSIQEITLLRPLKMTQRLEHKKSKIDQKIVCFTKYIIGHHEMQTSAIIEHSENNRYKYVNK